MPSLTSLLRLFCVSLASSPLFRYPPPPSLPLSVSFMSRSRPLFSFISHHPSLHLPLAPVLFSLLSPMSSFTFSFRLFRVSLASSPLFRSPALPITYLYTRQSHVRLNPIFLAITSASRLPRACPAFRLPPSAFRRPLSAFLLEAPHRQPMASSISIHL